MCDYNLHNVASRPAKVRDTLITTKFADSLTLGFAAVDAPDVAVCLLPGTEIAFEKEAERRHSFAFAWLFRKRRFGKLGGKVARFRQTNLDKPQVHHDSLEFADGTTVLVTTLCPGQRATVLQLPAQPHVATDSVVPERPVLVS